MLEELDYRYEAAHLRRMKASLRRHRIYVPKPYVDYCTPRVLVMEFVPGVLMSDYIAMRKHDPARLVTWQEANNVDPEKVARRLFCSTLRQLLEDNLFHADLHPGNILLLKNSRVALIDLGTVGTVEQEFLRTYRLSLNALVARDFARAADYTLHYAPEAPTNVLRLREDLVRCYRLWEAKTHLRNLDYHQKSLGSVGTESGAENQPHHDHAGRLAELPDARGQLYSAVQDLSAAGAQTPDEGWNYKSGQGFAARDAQRGR
jgi:ubiquinone biosynthesis protein